MKINKTRLRQIIQEAISHVDVGGFEETPAVFRPAGDPNDSSKVCIAIHIPYDIGWHAVWESKSQNMQLADEIATAIGVASDVTLAVHPSASIAVLVKQGDSWFAVKEY